MFETGTDILMFLDIIISFFTIYERPDGSNERNLKKIARMYVRYYLIVDVLAALPTQFSESMLTVDSLGFTEKQIRIYER